MSAKITEKITIRLSITPTKNWYHLTKYRIQRLSGRIGRIYKPSFIGGWIIIVLQSFITNSSIFYNATDNISIIFVGIF
jgi:hypothetical protein